MNHSLVKKIVQYGLTSAICLGLAAFYFFVRIEPGMIKYTPLVTIYLTLCDAFTIPGITVLMLACLTSLSNRGALDGITYHLNNLFKALTFRREEMEKYGDYLERKRANRATGFGFLYVVGGICTGISLVFMALFYSIY